MRSYYVSLKEYLKRLNLNDVIINEIIQYFLVKKYIKNEYFVFINEVSDKIGFVVNGLFFMSTIQQDGSVFTKEFMKSEEFLLATFDSGKESSVNIQCIKDAIILEAKYSEVKLLLSKYIDLETISKKRMENQIELIYQRMTHYATITAMERYILFKEEYSMVETEIPQFLIASYLGITPTQLSRIRAKLKILSG